MRQRHEAPAPCAHDLAVDLRGAVQRARVALDSFDLIASAHPGGALDLALRDPAAARGAAEAARSLHRKLTRLDFDLRQLLAAPAP